MRNTDKSDFSQGSVSKNILRLAVPIMVAEFVHVLYNLVDRMYIGHLPESGTDALVGVGVTLPLISLINAFASLCGTGGSPLCSIARGAGDHKRAQEIMENSFTLLLLISAIITIVLSVFKAPALRLLGADSASLPFALEYFGIYVYGTTFVMISLGMNPFINSQGFSKVGMGTVILGASVNILLDPLFIFTFDLGVKGAALATVISQIISATWVICFLISPRVLLRLRHLRLDKEILSQILALGVSGFMFKLTNSVTQAVVNISLKIWGGALSSLYIGAMSIVNSLREVISQPISAVTSGAEPVIGFNFGAKQFRRVRSGIFFMLLATLVYGLFSWASIMIFPSALASIFSSDRELIAICTPCLKIYFGAFFLMSLQMTGQHTYVALNKPNLAVFFSLFRKVLLVIPLTLLLPRTSLGAKGVFYAEMISQIIGATLCFVTMVITVWRKLYKLEVNSPHTEMSTKI